MVRTPEPSAGTHAESGRDTVPGVILPAEQAPEPDL
ncbi:hypothetical protein GGQ96_002535 [Sphingomonas abaci]|uniref:Uncharacterized protein n=1 Tax=Sphingomonas abaci TaxID=237611 RepID=A0A7W7EY84_9SPHN|nr:hypothetical protein [Sphingomonas abaci]